LIDMREAPDAQVVLEIAVVRAVRPDLDSGMEALSERVAVLERSVAGAPAFPRPDVPVGGGRGGAGAPAPAAPSAAAASAEPAVDVAKRPSLGALKRSREAAAAAAKTAKAGEAPAAPAPEGVGSAEASASAPATTAPATAAPSSGERDGTTPSSASSAAPARAVDRDSLTEAWGDTVLRGLPARAKALFSAGRFVFVDADGGAHFALPNAAHRDRCLEMTPTVEAKLGEYFGAPVRLVLDVDDAAPPPASERAATPPPRPPAAPRPSSLVADDPGPEPEPDPGYDDSDNFDPAAFAAEVSSTSEDQAKEAEARLLQAFPGASEVGS
jgi:hypothetical protein